MGKQENQEWLHNLRVLFSFFRAVASEAFHNEGILIVYRTSLKEGGEKSNFGHDNISEAFSNTMSILKTVEKMEEKRG